jgi:hypothetical protein
VITNDIVLPAVTHEEESMTHAELESMVEHAIYEIEEFRKAITKLAKLKRGEADWNNTIESVLLHFRTLRAFFFSEGIGNHPDDLFAEHYVAGWKPTKHAVFEETKSDIDKRLAHLSLRRREVLSRGWPMAKMRDAIENLILEFKRALKPPEATWFSRLYISSSVSFTGLGSRRYLLSANRDKRFPQARPFSTYR